MDNLGIYTYLKARKNGGSHEPVVTSPALRLMDWEGTILKEYTAEQVASLTALSNPSSLNTNVDRDLLTFRGYNWALADIKAWVAAHEGECLQVGAIYTTTDGQDHSYRNNPRIDTSESVSMLKKGTTGIKNYAFNNCYSLTNINIPDGFTNIGHYSFCNCFSLTNINIPDSVTTIGSNAFFNCYSLTSINIPDSVTTIGSNAFFGCYSLTNINIPDSVTTIEDKVFRNCYSLTNINIPDSVTTIGNNAFFNCYSLTSINIPDSVTTIGSNAFSGCGCLTDIVIKGNPNLTDVEVFSGIYSNYLIYVPRANLPWYETATNWAALYAQDKIVAIEDNVDFLRAIGIDV